jgi:cell division protein FtsL
MNASIYQTGFVFSKSKSKTRKTNAHLNKYLVVILMLSIAAFIFLAQQTIALETKILETKKNISELATITTNFETSLAQSLSPEMLEEAAGVLNLIDTEKTSYLFENIIPVSAQR